MNNKEKFKLFVKKHPSFVNEVKNRNTTWQELYEIYDMYGEDETVWKNIIKPTEDYSNSLGLKNIVKGLKNINIDSLQENLDSLQKAATFIEDLTDTIKKKDTPKKKSKRGEPEPINRFFDD